MIYPVNSGLGGALVSRPVYLDPISISPGHNLKSDQERIRSCKSDNLSNYQIKSTQKRARQTRVQGSISLFCLYFGRVSLFVYIYGAVLLRTVEGEYFQLPSGIIIISTWKMKEVKWNKMYVGLPNVTFKKDKRESCHSRSKRDAETLGKKETKTKKNNKTYRNSLLKP